MSFKRTTRAVQRCKNEQKRRSRGREIGSGARRYWIVALSCLLLATAGGALLFLAFRKEKMPTDCPRHPCARGDDSDQELPLAANDSVGDGEGASFV